MKLLKKSVVIVAFGDEVYIQCADADMFWTIGPLQLFYKGCGSTWVKLIEQVYYLWLNPTLSPLQRKWEINVICNSQLYPDNQKIYTLRVKKGHMST